MTGMMFAARHYATGPANSLYLTAPVTTAPTTTVFTTDVNNPTFQQYGDAVSDAQQQIAISGSVPFLAHTTGGMINLEVWTHSTMIKRLTLDANGNGSTTLDLSGEVNGPLTLDVYCWDATAANVAVGSFTKQFKQRVHLFMTGGSNYVRPSTPLGAAGMTQVFLDDFSSLSLSTSDVSKTWYPYQPNGAGNTEFGDAVFIDPDSIPFGGVNPYTIVNSFLRIRCTNTPNIVDPRGAGRTWATGMLSTGRPNGVDGKYWLPPFYMECRFMFTTGETTWPAFWLVTQEGLTVGAPAENIEIDVTENYGIFPTNWRSGVIHYPLGGGAQINFPIPGASAGTFPSDTFTFDFHTYGILCTATTISMYMDNVLIGSVAMPVMGTGPTAFFAMIDHALGGGWPVVVPPAGYYDMWVDYFVVYR